MNYYKSFFYLFYANSHYFHFLPDLRDDSPDDSEVVSSGAEMLLQVPSEGSTHHLLFPLLVKLYYKPLIFHQPGFLQVRDTGSGMETQFPRRNLASPGCGPQRMERLSQDRKMLIALKHMDTNQRDASQLTLDTHCDLCDLCKYF